MREVRAMNFESGKACYPYDHPDTKAYSSWKAEQRTSAEEAWKRKPPAKRLNYAKLGVQDPFNADFSGLVGSGSNSDADMDSVDGNKLWIMRGFQVLAALANCGSSDLNTAHLNIASIFDDMYRKRQLDLTKKRPLDFGKALISVRIVLLDRGTPSTNGRIYLIPSSEQYSKHVRRLVSIGNKRGADDMNDDLDSDSDSDLTKVALIGHNLLAITHNHPSHAFATFVGK